MDRLLRLIEQYYYYHYSIDRPKDMDVNMCVQGVGVGDQQVHQQEQDQPSDQTDRKDTAATDDENGREDMDIDIEDETGKRCCRYYTGLLAMNGE